MKSFLLLSCLAVFALPAMVFGYEFNQNLQLGTTGVDVLELQKALNQDSRTQVSQTGAGSPGYETYYFGPATFSAVKKFQDLYAEEVLKPLNLSLSTGFVGELTRKKLTEIASMAQEVSNSTENSGSEESVSEENSAESTSSFIPEPEVVEDFIEVILKINKENGASARKLKNIEAVLRYDIENNYEDNLKKFEQMLVEEAAKEQLNKENSSDFFTQSIQNTLSYLGFRPKLANAATGIPFGGRVGLTTYCNTSQNWLIYIQPLPPTFASALTYTPFTQRFASYNIPYTRHLLGEYTPVGICEIYIPPYEFITITTAGTISPIVGSSPI